MWIPNPASDEFTVAYKGAKEQVLFILYNAHNEMVKAGPAAETAHTVRVDDLPEGFNSMHVFTDKAILARKRIVIKK